MNKSTLAVLKSAYVAIALLLLCVPQVHAAEAAGNKVQVKLIEDAIETSTDAVVLPTSNSGTLSLRKCTEPCAMKYLKLTEKSRFFVGSAQVTLKDFNAFIARSADPQFLMVFHEPGKPEITRLMVFGQL